MADIKAHLGQIYFVEGYDQAPEKVVALGVVGGITNKISDITRTNETAAVPNCATGEEVKYGTKSKVEDITVEYTLTNESDVAFIESAFDARKGLTAMIKSASGTSKKFNCIIASITETGADADAPAKYTVKLSVSGKVTGGKAK